MEGTGTGWRALVIGVGSTLRGDDGVAAAVLQALEGRVPPGVELMARHQLAPEVAADLEGVSLLVAVDADLTLAPGEVRAERA
ncbi:MAG TPA: hydrogenase maturation protease, partial [Deinococcales bacterium]|nr:hydrogenase maturation protease [Deinococcales bacterium]